MALSFHWDSGQVQGPQTHISCVDEDDADGPSCSGLNNYITMASCVVCAASASLFCKADACFLCAECDRTIHSANVVASRHVRVPLCEFCKRMAATVFCTVGAASLCQNCDFTVHESKPIPHHVIPIEQALESHLAHVNCCHVMPAAPAAAPAPEPAPAATTTGSTGLSASGDNETQNNNTQADPPAQAQANNTSAPPAAKGKGKGKVGAGGKDVLWAKELEAMDIDAVWLEGLDFADILGSDLEDDNLVPTFNAGPVPMKQPVAQPMDDDLVVPSMDVPPSSFEPDMDHASVTQPQLHASQQQAQQPEKAHLQQPELPQPPQPPMPPQPPQPPMPPAPQPPAPQAQTPEPQPHVGVKRAVELSCVPQPPPKVAAVSVPLPLAAKPCAVAVVAAAQVITNPVTKAVAVAVTPAVAPVVVKAVEIVGPVVACHQHPVAAAPVAAAVVADADPTLDGATLTREQRVARYLEKRKNRKFQKTIRYASRKAYAEVRPRIKGRFATREEVLAMRAAAGEVVEEEEQQVVVTQLMAQPRLGLVA